MQQFRKVRMGMIGGGEGAFIGAVHRMAAALDGKIELVCGAFSQDIENTKRTGAALALDEERLYSSYSEMFEQESKLPPEHRMELVSVVTPNHLHMPISREAMSYGFNVICDKPAGISLEEVAALKSVITETQCLFALTHTYAGYPMVWQARYLVMKKKIGELRKIYVEYPQGWLSSNAEQNGSKQAQWRTDPKRAGIAGCMGDIGTHAHHLAEFISNKRMTQLSAQLKTHIENRQLEDDGSIQFEMEDGVTGVLVASQVCSGEENALKIKLYGSEGGLEWSQMEPNSLLEKTSAGVFIHRAGIDKPLCEEALAKCRLPSGHPEGYLEAFANLYRDFATNIREEDIASAELQQVPGIDQGIAGMAFLQALVDSHSQQGAWTKIAAPNSF
ncbi:Gfo/Idh/MocA family oxidoreductase [Alteromonadaceae bacterium M269]|nr:Gfo/Idh/MocA family oxidoreductase [Alteromonadaceae bacterium M269]